LGAGLSSSASIEVAVAMALLDWRAKSFPSRRLRRFAAAENEYVVQRLGLWISSSLPEVLRTGQ